MYSRPWFGVGLALLVAACFAGGSALAGLAYRHGTDPLTVSTARTAAAVLVLLVLLRLRGVPIALPPVARRNALLLGQTMSPVQLLGTACVVVAITLGRASGRAPAAKPAVSP